jgi:hypothetical protein
MVSGVCHRAHPRSAAALTIESLPPLNHEKRRHGYPIARRAPTLLHRADKALADPSFRFREPDFVNETVGWSYVPRCVTLCLIGADVQHQGEADLFPGKGGELWASLWQEA